MAKNNVTALPNEERDEMQAALSMLERTMPEQAKLAKIMRDNFIKVGFDKDEALQLTAYAIFK